MKFVQVGACASIVLALVNSAFGYEFSNATRTTIPPIVGSEENTSTSLSSNQESRIYGGSEADVSKYPFIASLRFDPEGKTFCGGTLVAPRYILTAGHCIKTDTGQIYVSLGSEHGSGGGSGYAEQIKVVEGFRHPLFNNGKHFYDVGLLKLETPSTQEVAPLCAADGSDNEVGAVGTVLGWGLTEDRKSSFTLQEVNVAIISNAECDKEYGDGNRIREAMMCAGSGNGKDSCNGDSGGPLIANEKLVGLVSWGGKCGAKAGVYTRLAFVMDYINDVLDGDTDSTFPGSPSSSSLSFQEDFTPSPEAASSEGTDTRKTPATDAPADDASTAASFDFSSSTPTLPLMQSTTTPSRTTAAPTSQTPSPDSDSGTDASTIEVPASGKGCGVRRRRLFSK